MNKYEKKLKEIKVLDPACGSGAFLNQAFDYLLGEHNWLNKQRDLLKGGQSSIFALDSVQRNILKNNIFGVDLNEESVEITKLSLWLKTANKRKQLTNLDNNIKCGNSLVDDPEVADDKSFNWEKEFKKVLDNGGFDVVIGNPPYVQLSQTNISNNEKNYLIDRYKTSSGRLNTFGFFLLLGEKLLNSRGILGYIIPNTFLTQEYYKYIRKYLLDNVSIKNIVLYDKLPFVDAVVENITLIFQKKCENDDVLINTQKSKEIVKKERKIKQSDFLKRYNYIFDIYGNELAEKIENKNVIELGELCNINQAISLKKDKSKYIYQNKENITGDDIYKVIEGRNINKYEIDWDGSYLDYKIDSIHSCKRKDIFLSEEKLFFRRVAKSLIFAYDDNQLFALKTLVVVNKKDGIKNDWELKYLLCILNSNLMNYYYSQRYKSNKTVFPEVPASYVAKLPIIITKKNRQERFINPASKLIKLKKKLNKRNEIKFGKINSKYASKDGVKFEEVISSSEFKNKIYSGRARKIRNFTVNINTNIITIYLDKSSSGKYEVLKFEENDKNKRKYIKYYLENLTDEQLNEIDNKYKGNILKKTLQIEIPDYNKDHVVKKVIKEWDNLQQEIVDLENETEKIDNAIDQMVYNLYNLTEEEIKIIENS